MEAKSKQRPKKRGRQGYIHKSSALNVTVYDLHGKPIPDTIVNEILELVNEKSLAAGLMISFTRT